jgi:hypothetical protein
MTDADWFEFCTLEGHWQVVTFLGLDPASINLVLDQFTGDVELRADGQRGKLRRDDCTQVGAAIAVPIPDPACQQTGRVASRRGMKKVCTGA